MAITYAQFGTREQGLTSAEAAERLATSGGNTIPSAPPKPLSHIFIEQFKSPLAYILLVACVIVAILGEWVDAGVIVFVVLLNAIIGTFQEGRAQDTLAALKRFIASEAVVLRDGKEVIIPDTEVVVGDVLLLREGDKIPADARIVSAHTLYVDQAALTGESEPVSKKENGDDAESVVFRGTHCIRGTATAIVTAIGLDTMIGSIATQLTTIDTDVPLKKSIDSLSRKIVITIGIVLTFLFIIGFGRYDTTELLSAIVATAVSVIPESLPVVVTLILASGVWRMGKKNALVKRLQAVEALGQADIIAVDKTGTITKNEMMVTKIWMPDHEYDVTGDGYDPTGAVAINSEVVSLPMHPGLALMARLVGITADAHVAYLEQEKAWRRISGDPTDAAMAIFAQKLGITKSELKQTHDHIEEQPFTSESKYHSVTHSVNGHSELALTGSPEVVLDRSTGYWTEDGEVPLTKADVERFKEEYSRLMKDGLRVVACAMKSESGTHKKVAANELVFIGFVGIQDAIRREALPAITAAHVAGIRIVMITGDHQHTACSIAKEIGIWKEGDSVVTGYDIDTMAEKELRLLADSVTVFARVTPQHKLRIIELLKASDHIVAMTGDGVNDALSLVKADLGISMGKIGTQVAQEASDIVLMDDSLNSIVAAIEEGRHMFITIRRTVLYLLSTNLGELCVICLAMIAGYPIPFTPTQIIWLNLVTDSFLIAALAAEHKDRSLMRRSPKEFSGNILDEQTTWRMLAMALTMALTTYFVFIATMQYGAGRASAVALLTLISFQWFNVFNVRGYSRPGIWLLLSLVIVILLQWAAFSVEWLRKMLDLVNLQPTYIITAALLGSIILISDAGWRWYTKHTFEQQN